MGTSVRAEPQMTFEKIDPKENIDFKELRLLTQRGIEGDYTLFWFFYVRPQVFPPHPTLSFLHSSSHLRLLSSSLSSAAKH